jgi:hypothetical protein
MPLSDAKLVAAFRRGVECYLDEYGTRKARERTAHFWLATCITRELPGRDGGHYVIGELHTRKSDLAPLLPDTRAARALRRKDTGAFGYDICVSRDPDFDARSWPTVLKDNPDPTDTALRAMAVIAELKTADSTATTTLSLEQDLLKLLAVSRATLGRTQRPKLFLIAAPGPDPGKARALLRNLDRARERVAGLWPRGEEPQILYREPE